MCCMQVEDANEELERYYSEGFQDRGHKEMVSQAKVALLEELFGMSGSGVCEDGPEGLCSLFNLDPTAAFYPICWKQVGRWYQAPTSQPASKHHLP